jgi:hypothetical protein
MDPVDINNENKPFCGTKLPALAAGIDERISIHDFRVVPGNTHTNLIFDVVAPHRLALTDDALKESISRAVSGPAPGLFLRDPCG